jgi:hypothetical protein
MKPVISPTYRYFLRSKDSCVFLAYLQSWYISDTLISLLSGQPLYLQNFKGLIDERLYPEFGSD